MDRPRRARACSPRARRSSMIPRSRNLTASRCSGNYEIDDEGVKARAVALVENGILRNLLMSRRPGPDFQISNGHARSALFPKRGRSAAIFCCRPSDALKPADLKKKFIDACRDDGHEWCLEVRQMDNPALSSVRQEDFSDFIGGVAGGSRAGNACRSLSTASTSPTAAKKWFAAESIEGLHAARRCATSRASATMHRIHLHAESRRADSPERRSARSGQRKAASPAR